MGAAKYAIALNQLHLDVAAKSDLLGTRYGTVGSRQHWLTVTLPGAEDGLSAGTFRAGPMKGRASLFALGGEPCVAGALAQSRSRAHRLAQRAPLLCVI